MLAENFYRVIVFSCIALTIGFGAFGVYCRLKAKALLDSGRIPEIASWSMRSSISLSASGAMLIYTLIQIFVE
jgi:hypothetical protein